MTDSTYCRAFVTGASGGIGKATAIVLENLCVLLALVGCLEGRRKVGNEIRSVALCPGAVNTAIWDTKMVQSDFDRSGMLIPEIVAQTIMHTVSLLSHAVIEDVTIMPSAGAL